MTAQISEFLQNKWKQAFKVFDSSNDGIITQAKFGNAADSVSEALHYNIEQANKTTEDWVKWFSSFQTGPSVNVDKDSFLLRNAQLYQDVEQMKRMNSETATAIFDGLDRNKNRIISAKDLQIFYNAFGITNKTAMLEIFSKIDKNGDGFIRRGEFIDDFVRFFTDPDPVSGNAYLFTIIPDTDSEQC